MLRATQGSIALDDLDVGVAEPLEPLASGFNEVVLALDPDHLAGDAADDSCRVAGTGSDLEHLVAGLDAGRLDHQRDDIRLGNRLPRLDRQRMVAIRKVAIVGADELLARDRTESFDNLPLRDSAALQLALDHRLALGGIVWHGHDHGPPPDRKENR